MKRSIRSLLCRLCALLLLAVVMPMSASAYTMDDMCWSIHWEDGKIVLYLDGFWRMPEDGSWELHVDEGINRAGVDEVVLGDNCIGRGDIYRTTFVKDLYLPAAAKYTLRDDPDTICWFWVLHIRGDLDTLPALNYGKYQNIYHTLNGGFDIDGTVAFIPDDAFCLYEDQFQKGTYRRYAVMNLRENDSYAIINGVLARKDTGMPLWAADENIFTEGAYVYMYGQDKQSVMLWQIIADRMDIEPVTVLPDTTESGLPIRWISAQAMKNLGTNPANAAAQAVAKQQGKVDDAQNQLDRWIEGGKKSEKDIQKQRDKVEKAQGKLDELLAQQAIIDAVPYEVYLGRYVEAVSDFSGFELDIDMLYIPAGLTHKGEGLNQWTGVINIYGSVD